MAGQGKTTKAIAAMLEQANWEVVYTCVPNTPHVGVIAVPVRGGSCKQRYPDIVATRDRLTRLVEVEMSLTDDVAVDIALRFSEFVGALDDQEGWRVWKQHVEGQTVHTLPDEFLPVCDLVTCTALGMHQGELIARLLQHGITVADVASFRP